MRVLLVNTSERAGGAAVAAYRLMEALNNHGVKAKMLVRDRQMSESQPSLRQIGQVTVSSLPRSPWLRWHFLWERFVIFFHLHFSRTHLFDVDIANAGTDITCLPEFKEADVIHLHWVNQGMLSLSNIQKILSLGKPVVWTMHDIWPATAICHLTFGCRAFTSGCHHCKYLPNGGSDRDLSARVWNRKKRLLQGHTVYFVACSRWLEGEAKASALLSGQPITNIPNALNAHVFVPGSQEEARRQEELPQDKRLLLFVCQRANNPYKGMDYLIEACRQLAEQYPDMRENTAVVVLGSHAEEVTALLPFETFALGYVSDEHRIARIYQASDAFVLPSLSENLPNTIMEAMACGVPCIGFRVGGIPEEIDHLKNGYVAQYEDAADLANGIRWTLFEADRQQLSQEAVRKVSQRYSPSSVALRYIEVYQQAMAQKHFKL